MVTYRSVPRAVPMKHSRAIRWLVVSIALVTILFVLLNVALFVAFYDRTYPGQKAAGLPFGGIAFDSIDDKLEAMPLLPQTLDISYGTKSRIIPPEKLGISPDKLAMMKSLETRSWLPIMNILKPPDTPLAVTVEKTYFLPLITEWSKAIEKSPENARIVQHENNFSLVHQKNGQKLDTDKAQASIVSAIGSDKQTIKLTPQTIEPAVTDAKLTDSFKSLQTAAALKLTYSSANKQQTAEPAEIVSWYRSKDTSFAPSDNEIKAYLASLGVQWQTKINNIDAAVSSTKQALASGKPLDLQLQTSASTAAKTYTYCTAVRGVDPTYLPGLNRKLATTFADTRGWSLGETVRFIPGSSNCDFTVWLSSAAQMPSFGSICDSEWSCMVSPNVVINFDRWQNASPAWNAAGNNINDYGSMVINHETGHWLGFGHASCTGTGQPAPVMQQQSINLDGCTFNPWPTASEQAVLKTKLDL